MHPAGELALVLRATGFAEVAIRHADLTLIPLCLARRQDHSRPDFPTGSGTARSATDRGSTVRRGFARVTDVLRPIGLFAAAGSGPPSAWPASP
jgi:hypothetical protein